MTRLVLLILAILPLTAFAADLTCTVPNPNVARSQQLCEELRLQMRIRAADWNNNVCASQFLRIGLVEGERRVTTKVVQQTTAGTVNDAVVTFESTWPAPVAATCGDSVEDTEFGETCDDGNRVNGDGCDDSCQDE